MADKKKKVIVSKVRKTFQHSFLSDRNGRYYVVFSFQESTTPRRPVILKAEREAPKEQAKEKPEKEKQPTIILKTREQSAPKEERPHSPKTKTLSEGEGTHPCKIAQNENKEKKGTINYLPKTYAIVGVTLGFDIFQFLSIFQKIILSLYTYYLVYYNNAL